MLVDYNRLRVTLILWRASKRLSVASSSIVSSSTVIAPEQSGPLIEVVERGNGPRTLL